MLAVLITLTLGRWNELIDCSKAKVRIVVLPIMDMKTHWNYTMELLERAFWLREFTRVWLKNPKYSYYWPPCTTQDEWTIVKYVREVLRPFRYWTLWMSKRHTVTSHHVITVYNAMFDHMYGLTPTEAKQKTPGMKTWSLPWSSLDRSCPNIMLKWLHGQAYFSYLHMSSILFGSCNHLDTGTRKCISMSRTRHRVLHNTKWLFRSMWRINSVPNIDVCRSMKTEAYQGAISSPPQWL